MNVQTIRNRPLRPTVARMRGGQHPAMHDWLAVADTAIGAHPDGCHTGMLPYAPAGWPRRAPPPVQAHGPMVDARRAQPIALGGPANVLALTTDPDLHLMIDGRIAKPWWHDDHSYLFTLTGKPEEVRIVSRSVRPADLGLARDARELGVSIKRIVARQPRRLAMIPANDPGLSDGFHGYEPTGGIRWTNGDAVLPARLFHGFTGRIELELQLGPATRYPAIG